MIKEIEKISFISIGVLLLASPLIASAQSVGVQTAVENSMLTVIQSLQLQLQQLRQQLAQLSAQSGGGSGTVPSIVSNPQPPDVSNACVASPLSSGSTGAAVTALQSFLASQGLIASGSVTGHFGPITQAAVQQWQAQNGIVSSGTPATTGWGIFGPRSQAASGISLCGGAGG